MAKCDKCGSNKVIAYEGEETVLHMAGCPEEEGVDEEIRVVVTAQEPGEIVAKTDPGVRSVCGVGNTAESALRSLALALADCIKVTDEHHEQYREWQTGYLVDARELLYKAMGDPAEELAQEESATALGRSEVDVLTDAAELIEACVKESQQGYMLKEGSYETCLNIAQELRQLSQGVTQ